ncbi:MULTISPECIES: D-aminoacyl-tRNA deacylase [unclassified Legionella]|uniref:D-aminoacyl-tRNA deacylase n=1 Tax=unclassified Legionella TaxID=2622702 RepID=UPI0010548CE6|nr:MULTISPECIES: D-aminoacyl-tRNA deacylase [unclassified Legionella]MDI9819413.1 D-aminoacyl-tRNA deacylase [Legionella sp. PL877]
MLIVIQRVQQAHVTINEQIAGSISQGLVILCGFESHDNQQTLIQMLKKCLNYRVFNDNQGKMNLSLKNINGGLLLVPQFTLVADTNKGLRPSFSKAAPPKAGQDLFQQLLTLARENHPTVASGQFGADMQVHLCNDGPVTFVFQF